MGFFPKSLLLPQNTLTSLLFFTEFIMIFSECIVGFSFTLLTMIISLLKASEVLFSLMEKMFDQVTVQMEAATCRLLYIGRGIWRLHVLRLKCQVPGCDSD